MLVHVVLLLALCVSAPASVFLPQGGRARTTQRYLDPETFITPTELPFFQALAVPLYLYTSMFVPPPHALPHTYLRRPCCTAPRILTVCTITTTTTISHVQLVPLLAYLTLYKPVERTMTLFSTVADLLCIGGGDGRDGDGKGQW